MLKLTKRRHLRFKNITPALCMPWVLIASLLAILVWSSTVPYPGIPYLSPLTQPFSIAVWTTPSAMLVTLIIYAFAMRRDPLIFYICAIAFLTMFLHMFNFAPWAWQYDWWQNIETIEFYANNNFMLPEHNELQEAHQAPLYYIISGLIYKLSLMISRPDMAAKWLLLQAFSFLCFALFLLYGILMLKRCIPSRKLFVLGVALIMFWPSNIMHCGRLSSNILIYLAVTGGAYHMMSWFTHGNLKELNRALLWMGLGFATQTSAVILLASFGVLAACRRCRGHNVHHWPAQIASALSQPLPYHTLLKPLQGGIAATLAGVIVSYGRNFYNYLQDHSVSLIFGTYASKASFVPWFYFTLNLPLFFNNPYIVVGDDQHVINVQFWGFYLRSMNFGQHVWVGNWQAIALNTLLLCQWAYMLVSMLYLGGYKRQPLGWAGYSGLFLLFIILAQATAKAMIPDFSYFWADARYVYAVIVFFVICNLVLALMWRQRGNRLAFGLGVGMLASYNLLCYIHIFRQLAVVWGLHPH